MFSTIDVLKAKVKGASMEQRGASWHHLSYRPSVKSWRQCQMPAQWESRAFVLSDGTEDTSLSVGSLAACNHSTCCCSFRNVLVSVDYVAAYGLPVAGGGSIDQNLEDAVDIRCSISGGDCVPFSNETDLQLQTAVAHAARVAGVKQS